MFQVTRACAAPLAAAGGSVVNVNPFVTGETIAIDGGCAATS
ncbi:MAG: hypothetical protein ACRDPY_26720 [Streptosporangiaceae bacterium]